jgi:hypothetical protein
LRDKRERENDRWMVEIRAHRAGLHRNDKGRSCAVISQFYAPSQISARLPWHH